MKRRVYLNWCIGLICGLITLPLSAQEYKLNLLQSQNEMMRGFFKRENTAFDLSRYLSSNFTFQIKQELPPESRVSIRTWELMRIPQLSVNTAPIELPSVHRGEFVRSGVMVALPNGVITGFGKQENILGVGIYNRTGGSFHSRINDKLRFSTTLHLDKLSTPHRMRTSVGTSGRLMYDINDKLTFNTFGAYMKDVAYPGYFGNWGATVDWKMTDRFGLEVGAQQYKTDMHNKVYTAPVVIPYVMIGKSKVGIDVGPMIQDLIRGVVYKGRGVPYRPGEGPMPMPMFPPRR